MSSPTEGKVPQLKYKMRKRNPEVQGDIKRSKAPGVEISQLRRENGWMEPDEDKVIENKTRRQGEELHTLHTSTEKRGDTRKWGEV